MKKEQEKKWREEIQEQLKNKEKKKEKEEKLKEEEQLTRIEYAQKEQIRREEEESFYSDKGFMRIKNKYGENEWVTPEDASKKKKRSKKRKSKKKKLRKKISILEIVIFAAAVLTLYVTYKYFKNKSAAKVKPAVIVINSTLPGAKIFLNGKYTNRLTPDTISGLKPGQYWVSVDKKGYEELPNFINVSLKSGQTNQINFDFQTANKTSTLIIKGITPPFSYYLNGHFMGTSKKQELELPVGKHLIRIEKNGNFVQPAGKWLILKENKKHEAEFINNNSKKMGQLKITSNVSEAFIFINGENSGLLPSNKYFSLPADNYSIRLSHPDYKFTPLKRIIKLEPGENNMIIISGKKHPKKGKILITDCLSSQICIDGHLTINLCGLDTLTAISGKHFITVLNQTDETLNKSEWVTFNPDSIYQICWSANYKQWEKVNKN